LGTRAILNMTGHMRNFFRDLRFLDFPSLPSSSHSYIPFYCPMWWKMWKMVLWFS